MVGGSPRRRQFGVVCSAPAGAGLGPEDGGGDGLGAVGGGLAVERLGHLGVGLDMAEVEFVAVVLAEGLGVASRGKPQFHWPRWTLRRGLVLRGKSANRCCRAASSA